MPFKIRDPSPERRRTSLKKDAYSTEKTDRKDRERLSHRKSSTKDRTESRKSESTSHASRRSSIPDTASADNRRMGQRAAESKTSTPYPSFSKAHSKEAIGSRESVRPAWNIFTPPATDLEADKEKVAKRHSTSLRNAPPSPPLTDQNAGARHSSTARHAEVDSIVDEDKFGPQDNMLLSKGSNRATNGASRVASGSENGIKSATSKPGAQDDLSRQLRPRDHKISSYDRTPNQPSTKAATMPVAASAESATNISSNATLIAPDQTQTQRPTSQSPPVGSQHEILSQVTSVPGIASCQATPLEIFIEDDRVQSTAPSHYPPPPPPPPPNVPVIVPKVDYLLQNGGLHQNIPKTLLLAGKPMAIQQAAFSPGQPPTIIANLFQPYNQLLDDFQKVISKNGSLAVATGYRSVARRLLERLEAVFARDISSETCQCCICLMQHPDLEESPGVSWGEILELVSGRRDLPCWPPFAFVPSATGLGISLESHVPMQKLDIDVPEEYREHYIRQSRKTKQSVDKWLGRHNDGPTSPPEEVDDETLMFAILTHLPAEQRPVLTNLLGVSQGPIGPPRRAPSPERGGAERPASVTHARERTLPIIRASAAIERLYRLGHSPRDAETALFLLNNPDLHNALATLAEISNDEWDILVSGRFDGFLRSGADDVPEVTSKFMPIRFASRGPTPVRVNGHSRQSSFPSRGTTPANAPAKYGAPVALDEETEIATLAEIERDIYTGMEALEDAFEVLHQKAEMIRKSLRERSAGLAAAAQRRRGSILSPEIRGGTPASVNGLHGDRWDAETDDGLGDWDGISELAPDDSASNISSSRKRRPKRRNERRTPVPVVEEDDNESYGESDGTASPKKTERGR